MRQVQNSKVVLIELKQLVRTQTGSQIKLLWKGELPIPR